MADQTMTPDPSASSPDGEATRDQPVVCSKCGFTNSGGGNRCVNCRSHLHVRCPMCRRRNLRSAAACASCGELLNTSKSGRRLANENTRLMWLGAGLIAFLILSIVIANLLFAGVQIAEKRPNPGTAASPPPPKGDGHITYTPDSQ